jgi:hypothetical protein
MATKRTVVRRIAATVGPIAAGALALTLGLSRPNPVRADGASEATEKRERCATRLSIAFVGTSPSAALAAATNPQDSVDALLADPAFVERFARYINSEFNPDPGATLPEDASYTLAKHVLTNKLPWKQMFTGAFDVTDTVTPAPNGLGYFRSQAWMRRYAGNEDKGYRLVSAYRILQNTTGLQLSATTNVAGVDLTADGRKAPACAGCHYTGWYALDKVLSRRQGMGNNITFVPPDEGPQTILDGKAIADDKQLVESLVESENYRFNVCRLAFRFLYGRAESTCEATVFDKCVDAFTAEGTITSAVGTIAKDPTFCQ